MYQILKRKLALISLIVFCVIALIFLAVFITDLIRRRKSETKYHTKESVIAFALLLPATVLAFFLVVLPILFSLGYESELKANEWVDCSTISEKGWGFPGTGPPLTFWPLIVHLRTVLALMVCHLACWYVTMNIY